MFRNVGSKLKKVALIYFCVMTAIFVILGLLMIPSEFLKGLLIMILGPCISLVSSWIIYGFAEIIDKVTEIERNTRKEDSFNNEVRN